MVPVHSYFLINGELKHVNEFIPFENNGGIYEVLRVEQGIPLFLEEHLQRFYTSAKIAGKQIVFSKQQIALFLETLINENKVHFGNILLSCKTNLKAFFIAHRYPDKEQYREGVVCGVLHAERDNPNAKVFQTSVRKRANELIQKNAFYEVLLVDHLEKVTEGSRSNVFFIEGNSVITPCAQNVLLGITRQKIIACAQMNDFPVQECDIRLDELARFDALFLTGTSPKVLPVNRVGANSFDVENKVLKKLMTAFDRYIEDYIKNARH